MKIQCVCGNVIHDVESHQSKAHLLPDESYFSLLDSIDEAIESSNSSSKDKEATCMKVRSLLGQAARIVRQCGRCARLYVERPDGTLECFAPSIEEAALGVLSQKKISST